MPHLFLISSASKWNDPANQPWLMALPRAPNYVEEAGIEVRFARAKNPNARFAILYQNDDAGKDYLRGVKEALGADADKAIAMASSFEVADPTVDSQILTLANTKADVFLIYSVTPRACAQAIRKALRDRLAADALHLLGLRQQGNGDGAGRRSRLPAASCRSGR